MRTIMAKKKPIPVLKAKADKNKPDKPPKEDRRRRKSTGWSPSSPNGPPVPPPPKLPQMPDPVDDGDDRQLSPTELVYVQRMLISDNSAAAYRVSCPEGSYKNASRNAAEMYSRPHVQQAIAQGRLEQCQRAEIDADDVLQLTRDLAFTPISVFFDPQTGAPLPPGRIPEQFARLLSAVRVCRERRSTTQHGETQIDITETILEYKMKDGTAALAMLHKNLGLDRGPLELDRIIRLISVVLGADLTATMRDALKSELAREPAAAKGGSLLNRLNFVGTGAN